MIIDMLPSLCASPACPGAMLEINSCLSYVITRISLPTPSFGNPKKAMQMFKYATGIKAITMEKKKPETFDALLPEAKDQGTTTRLSRSSLIMNNLLRLLSFPQCAFHPFLRHRLREGVWLPSLGCYHHFKAATLKWLEISEGYKCLPPSLCQRVFRVGLL